LGEESCFYSVETFLLDGRLEIDNNRSERSIKPFVIGRKNWMFSNTPRGARGSAIMYNVIETAKENNLSPYHYLLYLFETLPNIDLNNKASPYQKKKIVRYGTIWTQFKVFGVR